MVKLRPSKYAGYGLGGALVIIIVSAIALLLGLFYFLVRAEDDWLVELDEEEYDCD